MQYLGSKRLIAKYIIPIILENRKPDQWYAEPFVGGANCIVNVTGKRIGSDCNPYLIALLQALQQGWDPPREVTFEEYKDVRDYKYEYPDHLVGYVGFCLSFGAKWFAGFIKNAQGKTERDRLGGSFNNAIKTGKALKGINLICSEYDKLEIPANSIIYCDPPYKSTTGYKGTDPFDHDKFWQWCRNKEYEGHSVFISEYQAPDDFECIWQKQVNCNVSTKETLKPIEKLFKYNIL